MIGAPAAALKMLFGTNPNKGYSQQGSITGGMQNTYKINPGPVGGVNIYKTKTGTRGLHGIDGTWYEKKPGSGKFYQTGGKGAYVQVAPYNSNPRPPSSGGGTYYPPSSGGGSGLLDYREGLPPSNIGPYPRPNKYFPLLTQEYDRPEAKDYSEFIQAGNPFGGDGGLLYQPWSQQYSEQYGLPDKIAQYQPNIFGVGRVGYYGAPFGALNITPPEEIFASPMEESEEPTR